VRRLGIPPVVPGPVRIQDGPRHHLLTSRFSGGRSVNYLDIRGFRPGGDGLTHLVSSGTNHARKEPDRSRDSPVTLLHCSIRTRGIRTALATRRAQRGSPAQGWRVRTAAGIRPANPFLAWIHGSVPQVQPRPCGTVSGRFGEHPCAGEGQLGHRFLVWLHARRHRRRGRRHDLRGQPVSREWNGGTRTAHGRSWTKRTISSLSLKSSGASPSITSRSATTDCLIVFLFRVMNNCE